MSVPLRLLFGFCAVLTLLAGCQPASTPASPQAANSGIDLGNFDPAVRHQDDFYHSVNGHWLATTAIPADKSNYGAFSQLADEAELNLKAILEEALAAGAADAEQAKLAAFWTAYMDEAGIEQRGLSPLQAQLAAIDAATSHDALAALMGQLLRQGVDLPFVPYVHIDGRQSDRYVVYLQQSGLGLPDRDYFVGDNPKFVAMRQHYRQFVADFLSLAGFSDGPRRAAAIYAIEEQLARAQMSRVDNRDAEKTYNARTPAEMVALLDGFSWAAYAASAGLAKADKLVVGQPDYLAALGHGFTAIAVADWQDYLRLRLLASAADYLPAALYQRYFAFYGTTLKGISQPRARWKRAVTAADQQLGELLGKIYVARHFSPAAKARMAQLVDNLIAAFGQSIDDLAWMSPATKEKARHKLAKFNAKIGYPEQWRDYRALEIKADDPLGNYQRAAAWEFQRQLAKLGQPIDRSEWLMTPQTVNAYYSAEANEIVFPAAILQPPFFNLNADDAVNYGAIGAVIGHEISHGFDDQGSKYDGDGNLNNWWSAADRAAFEQLTARLVAQFNGYQPLPNMAINGQLTLGENIADLSGLAVALKAYQLSLAGQQAPRLDGFSGEQRFFLGWSQVWRRNYREQELRTRLVTDPHSPSQYRVNGVVSHLPEFHQQFAVKPGDGMYLPPEQRLKIW